ncbi:peroxiredoxin [Methylophilaceae bacterium]|jgi:peroxiredoxin Q/BCP|nr:peroxiredoxin [Nitrosomonadales bacterium]MBT6356322.1 peroxiredoxin [Nitrosomonadales bacterium]MCH9771363.1 peroxiredoxin [Betaproteobacteria bacterium]MDA9086911.1 peroxiredoxin [Methylophilaceae bacterium]|tara:strand:- start:7 stop:468 length:462 start_codon:yes stop_codon:yes gene_type:complete
MSKVEINKSVTNFSLPGTGGTEFSLSNFLGKTVVLYFYPRDSTPGCTNEGIDFTNLYGDFQKKNVEIFGISRDSINSHEKFKKKYSFPFELLSDSEEVACALFDVIKMKNMYGKQVQGIERSTFLIDPEGILIKEWRGLKVPGHADEVLSSIS